MRKKAREGLDLFTWKSAVVFLDYVPVLCQKSGIGLRLVGDRIEKGNELNMIGDRIENVKKRNVSDNNDKRDYYKNAFGLFYLNPVGLSTRIINKLFSFS